MIPSVPWALLEAKAAVPPTWALRLPLASAPGGSAPPRTRIGPWKRRKSAWVRSCHLGVIAQVYWNAEGESDELKLMVELPLRKSDMRNPIVFSTYPRSDGTPATPWDLRTGLVAYDKHFPFFPDEHGRSRLQYWRGVQEARTVDIERAMRLCDLVLVAGLSILADEEAPK